MKTLWIWCKKKKKNRYVVILKKKKIILFVTHCSSKTNQFANGILTFKILLKLVSKYDNYFFIVIYLDTKWKINISIRFTWFQVNIFTKKNYPKC